jgi:hypothetical protein
MSYSGERMVVLRRECCVFEREVLFLGRKCSSIWGRKLLFSGRSVLFWGEKGAFWGGNIMFPEQAFGRGYVLFGGKVVFWGQNGLIA